MRYRPIQDEIEDLKRERDELREDNKRLIAEILSSKGELATELAELRKDKARLDWLEALPRVVLSRMAMRGTHEVEGYGSDGCDFCCEKNTIREAIDAAMEKEEAQ